MAVDMDRKTLEAMRAYHAEERAKALKKAQQAELADSEGDAEPAVLPKKAVKPAVKRLEIPTGPPSMSAFNGFFRMPVSDRQGVFDPSIARHAVIKPGTVMPKRGAAVAKHDAIVETETDSGAATKASTKAAGKQAATGEADDHTNQVAVIDFANVDVKEQKKQEQKKQEAEKTEEEDKEANESCAIANDDEDRAEDKEAAERHRAAYVKEMTRRKEIQMEAPYKRLMLRKKTCPVVTSDHDLYDAFGRLKLDCRPVTHARNPDGTLVSELALQLRREDAEIAAACEALDMDITEDVPFIDHGDRDPPPVPNNTPTDSAPYLPVGDPLSPPISNPPDTPPHTPRTANNGAGPSGPSGPSGSSGSAGHAAPAQPPPAPNTTTASTHAASRQALEFIPRRRQDGVMTPPLSLPVAAPTLVSAVASLIQSVRATFASQYGSSGKTLSTQTEDTPLLMTSDGTRLIRSPRDHDPTTLYGSSAMDKLVLASGISKAERLCELTERRSTKPERGPRSYLIGEEITDALRKQILHENKTAYIGTYYGLERNTADKKTGSAPKKISRETSAAYSKLQSVKFLDKIDQVLKPAAPLRRNRDGFFIPTPPCPGFGNNDPPSSPEIELIDVLCKGECFDFRDSPNMRGW